MQEGSAPMVTNSSKDAVAVQGVGVEARSSSREAVGPDLHLGLSPRVPCPPVPTWGDLAQVHTPLPCLHVHTGGTSTRRAPRPRGGWHSGQCATTISAGERIRNGWQRAGHSRGVCQHWLYESAGEGGGGARLRGSVSANHPQTRGTCSLHALERVLCSAWACPHLRQAPLSPPRAGADTGCSIQAQVRSGPPKTPSAQAAGSCQLARCQ